MVEHKQMHNLADEAENVDRWELPDVGASLVLPDTDVFGRKSPSAKPAAPTKPITPPTMAEIEQIRQEAEQEGFAQGHSEGLEKGREEGRLQGFEQGHAEGFEQGQAQGFAEGLAQAHALIERFDSFLSQFEAPLALVDNQVEQSLLALVQTLVKTTVHHELTTHPEQLLAALRIGVEALPMREQRVDIRLNPDDLQMVEQLYGAEQLQKNNWQLQKDPALTAGGCIIECRRSQVDMQLEPRLAAALLPLEQQQQQLQQTERQLKTAIAQHIEQHSQVDTDAEVSDDQSASDPTAE
ncbi:flagellar assembly protein FliH [Shewanella avicenniae]|uniref:Flagellar assembly protein FliH n=1 Tax=Shewanella avicenniae TaxID=2814294 RepID=A0ABX7QNY8_9GAMM|nr:flagellar assembly protein FliH [Shewanella avicenniae]QSX32722.1 flagellar assembly protein FliH [Shewanella avicenniae]